MTFDSVISACSCTQSCLYMLLLRRCYNLVQVEFREAELVCVTISTVLALPCYYILLQP